MKKQEAIKEFVSRLDAVPQEWVRIVAEHDDEYPTLPMWGTMWILDTIDGERLLKNSRVMLGDNSEINPEDIEDKKQRARVEKALKELEAEEVDWACVEVLEQYVDEEMSGERCVLDKDGETTAIFIYEVGNEYVIGVNGAGWDFYDGVWDRLYDTLGLKWHTDK